MVLFGMVKLPESKSKKLLIAVSLLIFVLFINRLNAGRSAFTGKSDSAASSVIFLEARVHPDDTIPEKLEIEIGKGKKWKPNIQYGPDVIELDPYKDGSKLDLKIYPQGKNGKEKYGATISISTDKIRTDEDRVITIYFYDDQIKIWGTPIKDQETITLKRSVK